MKTHTATSTQKTKNTAKYLSYKAAFERIKDAIEKGFPFEAITLCESIMSDRLLSYMFGAGDVKIPIDKPFRLPTFKNLIDECKRLSGKAASKQDTEDLMNAVNAWRELRNDAVHNFAKSLPGKPTMEVETALTNAKTAARKGASLARKVCAWHTKNLRLARKTIPA